MPLGVRDMAIYAVLSAALALIPFLIFYPGLWTNDSVGRWSDAYHLVEAHGLAEMYLSDWFPPMMTLAMAASLKLTGTVTVFTYLQYWLVAAAAMTGGHALGGGWRSGAIIGTAVGFMPGVFESAALVMPDPWTAAAIAVAAAGLVLDPRGRAAAVAFRLFLLAADAVLLGFRANSILLLAVLLILSFLVVGNRVRRAWYCGILIAALIFDLGLAHLRFIHHIDVVAPILLWEITCTLKVLNDPSITAQYAMPDLGDMSAAVAATDFWVQDVLYWRPGHPFTPEGALAHSDAIRSTWWLLVTTHPLAYLEAKLRIWRWLAGFHFVDRPFAFLTQQAGANPALNALMHLDPAGNPDRGLGSVGQWIDRLDHRLPDGLYSPWRTTILAIGAAAVTWGLGGHWRTAALFCLVGMAYYAAFFVISPGFQLRYFFPCQFLYAIVAVAAATCVADAGVRWLR
ncbi:MAG TPA: hypothetical protein VKS60_18700, partial [Stellaceae bacterium]|nr:hypothetical protein [Stellaceae bacterium]